jgi:hypothetical protein
MSTTQWTVAFTKATTWRTAESVGANDGLVITQESMPEGIPEPIKDENIGDSLVRDTYQGNINAEGAFSENVRFEGFERRLALFMADHTATAATPEVGAATHTLEFQPTNNGLFGTLVMDKGLGALGSALWEYPSLKLSQLELSHDNGRLIAAWTAMVDRCVRTVADQVNDGTSMGAVTNPTDSLMTIFQQMKVFITEVTGSEGNLDNADIVQVSALNISVNRNLEGDHVSADANDVSGVIDEPVTGGSLPSGTITMTFPQYTTAVDTLLKAAQEVQAGRQAKRYKITVVWTGPPIPGTATPTNYLFAIDIASAKIMAGPAQGQGPGQKVPVELGFDIVTADAAGDGTDWAWVVSGESTFRARLINTSTTEFA